MKEKTMSWQHMDHRGIGSEERSSTESEYRDSPHYNYEDTLSGQKIYPRSASSSPLRPIVTTISLVLWLLALFIVLIILLITPTSVVTTSSNSVQPLNGSYILFVIAIFLLLSVFLLVINLLVRKKR